MTKPYIYTYEQEARHEQRKELFIKIALGLVIFLLTTWLLNGFAMASEIPKDKAILAVIGEAENQGYEGMLAVSCAIRNRGTLKGVYGVNAPRVKKGLYTKKTWLLARKAWLESEELIKYEQAYVNEKEIFKRGKYHPVTHHWRVDGYDPSGGANSWENTNAFGRPTWASSCEETVTIKDHVFFRCPNV